MATGILLNMMSRMYPQMRLTTLRYLLIISIGIMTVSLIAIPSKIAQSVTVTSKEIPVYEITTREVFFKNWDGVKGKGFGDKYHFQMSPSWVLYALRKSSLWFMDGLLMKSSLRKGLTG